MYCFTSDLFLSKLLSLTFILSDNGVNLGNSHDLDPVFSLFLDDLNSPFWNDSTGTLPVSEGSFVQRYQTRPSNCPSTVYVYRYTWFLQSRTFFLFYYVTFYEENLDNL